MALPQHTNRFYEFGPFRVDSVGRLLLRDGEVVPLTPKEFDILLVLVENRGDVVEKERLMREIWPDSFVEEGNLTTNISTLRKALEEGEEGQRCIQTLPRRGYRFVGQVSEVMDGGAGLIVQEHAQSHIVIEQEQETQDTGRYAEADAASRQKTLVPRWGNRSPKWTLAVTSFALLAVTAALASFWIMNKPKPQPPASSAAALKSIAVLPFKPLVADNRNESLELGMAETLINKLSPMRRLIVLPISAVRKYTGLEQDPIAAGRELGVDYVLEGNLQMAGDKTRATMRLLSVKEGSAIWTDKCDEQCSNVFELQDRVAERIAGTLALELTGDEREQLAKHYTDDPEAYQLYNLGVYYRREQTKEGFEKSIDYFEQAKKKDPTYAMAYVGLSLAYLNLGQRGYWVPMEARQKAERAALKAVQLDETLGDAHAILGYLKKNDWDWAGAEKELKRALQLDPNSYFANYNYCSYLVNVGRADEALLYAKRADELDPTNPNPTDPAWVYFHLRQYDTAIELYREAVERNPNSAQRHRFLGEVYVAKGTYREGIAELQKAVALNDAPEEPGGYPTLAYAYAVAGNRYDALKILDKQKELAKQRYISPYNFAIIYTGLGDKDRAFEYLEKACEEGVQAMPHLHSRPMWDSLRSDPHYTVLLRRMNLAQ